MNMSAYPGKYIIGLTGNIATGKSMVRKMLEFLGAFGIDADQLAFQALDLDSPGYHAVRNSFGDKYLNEDRMIDRSKLANLVFQDSGQLLRLEAIVHPLVINEVESQITAADSDVFVIEAIKLIEASLHEQCDSLWVTASSQENQLDRLMIIRDMDHGEALLRITAQSAQQEKISFADVVIRNNNSITNTWDQVLAAWVNIFPDSGPPPDLPAGYLDCEELPT